MTTRPERTSSSQSIRSSLTRLTVAKSVANTALRWIPPFLPTLERAFGASTTQLTTVLGAGEIAGLSTVAAGRHLDRGRERIVIISSMSLISASSVVALGGSIATFAVAFVLLVVGVSNFTVAAHAWISHRVDYRSRARSFGLFETSWALALLVGGPVVALLINQFGWRGPFVMLAVTSGLAALLVATTLPRHIPPVLTPGEAAVTGTATGEATTVASRHGLTRRAWSVVGASAALAASGLSVFVISGTWLDEQFGVSTGGLGYIVMGFGAIELVGSIGTAAFADRLGKIRSTLGGIVVLVVGLGVMLQAGDQLVLGVVGLLLFLFGFEFSFVTSLSLISEAMPDARGTTLATANAVATLTRGGGTIASGWLFARFGIEGTAALSGAAAAVAAACLLFSRRSF